jgi:fatty-acid peroxygenase
MPKFPRARGFDQSLALAREGYAFVANRCEQLGSDVFQCRLMLSRAVCARGAAAAEMFYSDRFTRNGAMPPTVLRLLQDYGSVQLLDDRPHRHRKQMFLAVGRADAAASLAGRFRLEWEQRLKRWQQAERIVLFDELEGMLTRVAADWAGVPLDAEDEERRAREFSAMLNSTGSVGPAVWRALWLRNRCERWARDVIEGVRAGSLATPEGSPLQTVAFHRDLDGELLSVKSAAVELINVLRPIVAVARFIAFAAKALHEHPEARERIRAGDAQYLHHFAEEVRRISPFFPVIGGRVREGFEWSGYRFQKGDWVLLDLYGTNHDRRTWKDPEAFNPDRFVTKWPTPYELVPQGAGEVAITHRCPGEHLAMGLIKMAARLLTATPYVVPEQDLSVDLARIPALPKSGFVMTEVAGQMTKDAFHRPAPNVLAARTGSALTSG